MTTYTITNKHFVGNKIEFIKSLRKVFDLSLKEAKDIADSFDKTTSSEITYRNLSLLGDEELSYDLYEKIVCNSEIVEEKFINLINTLLKEGSYDCAIAVIGCLKGYKNYEY